MRPNPNSTDLNNKKVLLRERKRHTARHIASTRYAALSNPDLVGGGVPHPDLVRGYPIQTWLGVPPHHPDLVGGTPGTPHPDLVRGVPHPDLVGGYPGYLPHHPDLRWGTPHLDMGWGTPNLRWGTPHLDLGWGTPLPRPEMGYPPT